MTDTQDAADALDRFDTTDAVQGAEALAEAFEVAGDSIARSLERAAERGELSIYDMVEALLKDLARLAITELIEGPIQSVVDSVVRGVGGGSGASTTITMNLSGVTDAQGFRRSEGQIGASLARAVSSGATRI